jgi:hypothetical protein
MTIFAKWLIARESDDHRPILSAPFSIVPIIAAAGSAGSPGAELGQIVGLESHVLNELLRELLSVGWITATAESGRTVYRALPGLSV